MHVEPTAIPDVLLLTPKVFEDERGFFMESYNRNTLQDRAGITAEFVQDNHSRSIQHTLRGIHYQVKQPQGKLVRVAEGSVYDVAVDLRRRSPTFGKWLGVTLSAENKQMLWVPPGFGHAFLVLSPTAQFLYKATDYYAPQHERSIIYNDPTLKIAWPPEVDFLLSKKDRNGATLEQAELYD